MTSPAQLQTTRESHDGGAWFRSKESIKARIAPQQYADFAILSDDRFTAPEEQIRAIESALTVTGGDIVYAAALYENFAPHPLPAVSPAWSPVAVFGGFQRGRGERI